MSTESPANSHCARRSRTARPRYTPAVLKALAVVAGVWFTPVVAQAYIGPGAGLSALGSLLALLGAVLLTVIGFIWYPVKRVIRRWKAGRAAREHAESPAK